MNGWHSLSEALASLIKSPAETVGVSHTGMAFQGGGDRAPADYWEATRRPLACLVFLAPLLLFYELGLALYGNFTVATLRNGADEWLRGVLGCCGLDAAWLLPALILGVLVSWQAWGRYAWRVDTDTLVGMLAESLLLAFALVVLGQLQDLAFRRLSACALSVGPPVCAIDSPLFRGVLYVGAGVYEEFLFRLCLLPALAVTLFNGGLTWLRARVIAVVVTSLMFSAAHHVGPNGEAFALFPFVFRAVAGAFFAAVFWLRGFGIAVGSHAAYDLLVGLMLFSE
jgi:membrane protease YdiL (CAAX protease family)